MRKVKLQLQELAVDSFATGEEPGERGTVHGNVKVTDIRYCHSGNSCYTDNEPECATHWYGCTWACDTIEGSDCV